MDNMLNTPENLDAMNSKMRSSAVKTFRGLDDTLKANGVYRLVLKGDVEHEVSRMREYLDKTDEVTLLVATASEQSGGKSTASNVILNYPLLPEAETATTACATKIRYGEEPSVQIMYYAKPQGAEEFIDGPLFRYDSKHRIDKGIWQDLKTFAYRCVTDHVIFLENLQYFSKIHIDAEHPGDFGIDDIDMSPNDPRHVVLLLLFLFSTYIGQNDEVESSNRAALCKFREELMRKLGVDPDRDFVVLVRWNDATLKQGLVLVDLPGLGSSAGEKIMPDGTVRRSHDRISIEFMNVVDSVFLFFPPSATGEAAKKILSEFLNTERMKQDIVSKENRIIPIMNKADLANASATGINAIRAVLGDLTPPFICPISTWSGEYQFVRDGLFPIQRTRIYNSNRRGREYVYDQMLSFGLEPSEAVICTKITKNLQTAYDKAYSFIDVNGYKHNITLAEWVKMMTTDYLARLRALTTLEMLRVGMYAERQLVSNINMRISVLSMVIQGGSDMGKELARRVKKLVNDKLVAFVKDIETELYTLKTDIDNELKSQGTPMVNGYKSGFESIESRISSIIGTAMHDLRQNAFGNCIIDPNGLFFLESSRDDAKHNLQVLDNLKTSLRGVDVVTELNRGKSLLTTILQNVGIKYTRIRDRFLDEIYSKLASQVLQNMNEAYAETRQIYGGEDHGVSFDRFYRVLFEQLRDSILKKMQSFTDMASKMIQDNTEVADALSAVINYASIFSMQVQSAYGEAEERYLDVLEGKTAAGNRAFNVAVLIAQADLPFFSPDTVNVWSSNTTTELADMIQDRIPKAFDEFTAYISNLNQAGMLGTLDVLDDIIAPNIQHGQTEVKREIETLNAGLSEIRTSINAMFTEINHILEVLRGCDWSADEVKVIETLHHDISSDSGR